MRAIRIHEHGGVDKVVVDEIAAPIPQSNEVIVKIEAASINHLDIWVRNGFRNVTLPLPMILGSDGAGTIAEAGEEADDLKIGDRVLISPSTSCGRCEQCLSGKDNLCAEYKIIGEHCNGTDAELVAVKKNNVFRLPNNVSFEDAAASALVFITAYQMLVEKAKIQPLESVLVLGASSGVGTAAIEIARMFNARVIAVAGSDEKLEKARALGANEVINYNSESIYQGVRRITDKRGVDIVFEHVGKATWNDSVLSARRGGRIVTCGATTGFNALTDLRYVFSRQLTIYGSMMGSKSLLFTLLELLSEKKFKAVIDRTVHFTEVRKAHEIIESRRHFGKIVLTF
ncbi:MAG TPA: zinc-binding dehydrogenase [Candidatus Acidoferrales bacterium]|nr:zinc-binding dehydrogenase [Candidatus Acidoferrales bacterium]